ncbi:aminodeoxychorismate lyase [Paenibacillus harenae]|uniref:4-amino-4-deoxychorismate lyase n=1 Tax=Paenibacillus harenae TaxID=306543 RepID=A0ABT9U8F4_PAEHA|nr:aminodeoxychorismate lyase [Paenibacillus harenae]MDQ0115937.1 4-amino-4-deoxychorismate lyase [Paenibacillus harenae]
MKVGLNGSVKEASEAVISVYDHGFLYGLGLFETFRTYGGLPYLLDRHLGRLQAGCDQLGIQYRGEQKRMTEQVTELLAANGLSDGYVRLTVSAGVGELGLPTGDYVRPTELLLVKSLPPFNQSASMQGRELRLLQTRRNTPEGDVRFKSLHYMNNMIAKRELLASSPPAGAEGLMLTKEGWLAEGIVSNLFYVKDGVLYTPSIDTGILPGVTRGRVIELAREAGHPVQEGHFTWEELVRADEIWMTNSIQELIPITALSGNGNGRSMAIQIGDGCAGELTRSLLGLYQADASGHVGIE